MAALETTATVDTTKSMTDAHEAVAAYLREKKAKPVSNTPDRLEATTGSKVLIRLLGAFLSPRRMLPVRTVVELAPNGDATRATITAADNFGFGVRTGMKKRYAGILEERIAEVTNVLR